MTDGDISHDPTEQDGHASHAGHRHEHADDRGMCEEALQELYTFLDGELTETKRTEIKRHLDDCSPCLEVYDFEAELRDVIRHRCREQVPDSLRDQVAQKLRAFDLSGEVLRGSTGDLPAGP